jgi:hypothetical protein
MSPRRELLLVGAFVLLNVIVPLAVFELYPFSIGPMFCDAPQRYCDYSVTGPDGEPLPLADFGLQRTYNGNPTFGTGFRHLPHLDQFDTVPPTSEVEAWVKQRLRENQNLPSPVTVTQRVIADKGDGTVGETQSFQIKVAR